MTFKRFLMPLLVLGIMFSLTSMAFGQASPVNCSLSTPLGPSAHATATGHTEPIGAGPTEIPPTPGGGVVRVTCTNTSGALFNPGVVVLTISFASPITNTQSHPSVAAGVRVTGGTGDFAAAGATAGSSIAGKNVGISAVNNSAGTVVIGLGTTAGGASTSSGPPPTPPVNPTLGIDFSANTTSTFDLEGVLLSVNGKSGAVQAFLSSTGGVNITGGTVDVITSVTPGLADPTLPTANLPAAVTSIVTAPPLTAIGGGPAVLNSSGGGVKTNFTIRIQEAYASMFKESSQFNGGGVFPVSPSSDTQVNIVFNNIPTGFDISNCSAVLTDVNGSTAGVTGSPSASQTNVTSASPIITVNFNAPVSQTDIDVLWVTCAKVTVGSATLPLPSTSVTAQVTLAPTGSALSATSTALTGLTNGQIPRYAQLLQPSTPLTVVLFPPANTVLLVPSDRDTTPVSQCRTPRLTHMERAAAVLRLLREPSASCL
jgi:hypothetical protein